MTEASEGRRDARDGRDARGAPIDQPPPFWSRWSRIYWVIAGLLFAQTVAFWLLSRWAS